MEEISFDLVGKVLEEDIVSDLNILLLKKGSVLTETNILLLKKHNYKKVNVSEDVSFSGIYLKFVQQIEQLFTEINELKDIDITEWFEENQRIISEVQPVASFIDQLYQMKTEHTLPRHSANVGLLAFYIGKLLRYSMKNKIILWQMGVVHDIGKVKVPSKMITHPEIGWSMLKEVKGVNAQMLNAARQHHECIDGSGYPKGVNIKYLSVMVQIISVANTINNFLVKNENIFSLINYLIDETKKNKLNPAIIIPFVRHILGNSVGKHVMLNDKTVAEIVFIHENEPSQPLVHIKNTDVYVDLRKDHLLEIIAFA
ncbi:HD domain-containing protein [Anaerobacillus sp. CMMVII]|uniref:HD-GYP domain-containing protein n=1 Tax=Anaerobacillus sp. CMMVII TaxID=2755588 RepID=UPI0021B76D55|nr:HD domain-containing protein [Anaerobacillus sp. CMMVII]MCT8139417.1 HD domain-containing protein [Anaerobacillus sp. CMMVII]